MQYDPLREKTHPPSLPQINLTVYTVHTVTLYTHIQLYDATRSEPKLFERLYDRRLDIAMRGALLIRAFMLSGLSVREVPCACIVS